MAVGKDQNRNDELGMIRVLAFNAIKTLKAARMGQSKANMTHGLTSVLMARDRKSLING